MTTNVARPCPAALEVAVLNALSNNDTYEQISTALSVSRGKVYAIALRNGARKNEARIQERAADRKLRQREFLQTVLNA